jgi:hypothetical protein
MHYKVARREEKELEEAFEKAFCCIGKSSHAYSKNMSSLQQYKNWYIQ